MREMSGFFCFFFCFLLFVFMFLFFFDMEENGVKLLVDF